MQGTHEFAWIRADETSARPLVSLEDNPNAKGLKKKGLDAAFAEAQDILTRYSDQYAR